MLVNWSVKVGQLLGGSRGKVLRILILFLASLGILVGIYRARGTRILQSSSKPLKHSGTHLLSSGSGSKWLIVAHPSPEDVKGGVSPGGGIALGDAFVCSVARVGKESGWKTIIIGNKLNCCRMPECYSIHVNQFLRMSYRSASTLKALMEAEAVPNSTSAYREVVRNLAYIWVMHRGARHIFDAYVDEYIAAGVPIPKFEEELSRQLHTVALDESLALVEETYGGRERGRSGSPFRNPYAHFGRPDVRLVPGSGATLSPNNPPISAQLNSSNSKSFDFPSFRICEVRPPSIEKFLEIDDGWWDMRAPALVLPGDTMPPLCTRNTLFSPDVFWALPILPDYATAESQDRGNSSRIPPWYIRGLWSQSLLGDLGGSIRLTLSRVPTLQLNQNYFTGGDYERGRGPSASKLLRRWHCKSRSTFRCLLLMSKELSKSVFLRRHDLSLIEAWILDLKSIHYPEPPMLPRRRSISNPCLGADGLHGVSFFPALQPLPPSILSEEQRASRNESLRALVAAATENGREKRETSDSEPSPDLLPPIGTSYVGEDWRDFKSPATDSNSKLEEPSSYYSHFLKNSAFDRSPKTLTLPIDQPPHPEGEEFPILKAMTEAMCPGFGPLVPLHPSRTYSEHLLIVVFANQHYDLIPSLEVLYRPLFPNILYCGHPHISLDLYLRKYQSSEHRSFSFLPTYTRASYECVLGAMEMNYEVKGYLVINDETLLQPWGIRELDSSRIWVSSSKPSSSRHVTLTKESWKGLDPRATKLPKLLDGIIQTWKLFSYIMLGHEEGALNRGKREVDLDTSASSYIDSYSPHFEALPQSANKTEGVVIVTESSSGDVEVGEDEGEEVPELKLSSVEDLTNNNNMTTTTASPPSDEMESLILATPPSTSPDSLSVNVNMSTLSSPSEGEDVGVPLYHVEHVEPPTPPTWHKPQELHEVEAQEKSSEEKEEEEVSLSSSSAPLDTEETPLTLTMSHSSTSTLSPQEEETGREMGALLDSLQDVYLNMLHILGEYKEANESGEQNYLNHHEGLHESRVLLEDTKSHRISPREFRHIRCSLVEDGHSSELCANLRSYISTLGASLGAEAELDYDTIPMYYLPSWATKSFYSVANVLLHFGVMDELALPLLFRGLAPQEEWVELKRSPALKVTTPATNSASEDSSYFHPFNLHKVYSDEDKRKLFCANYLLKVFQL